MYIIGIIIIIVLMLVSTIIDIFNRFVKNGNQIKDAWSNIDVTLKRRHDLIPNLVNTVKGYAKHEQETLNQVVAAGITTATCGKTTPMAKVSRALCLQACSGISISISLKQKRRIGKILM